MRQKKWFSSPQILRQDLNKMEEMMKHVQGRDKRRGGVKGSASSLTVLSLIIHFCRPSIFIFPPYVKYASPLSQTLLNSYAPNIYENPIFVLHTPTPAWASDEMTVDTFYQIDHLFNLNYVRCLRVSSLRYPAVGDFKLKWILRKKKYWLMIVDTV